MVYDLIVIGSGPGGHAAAISSARQGAKVLVVEQGEWGGTCTNRGCVPTKALLACSRRFDGLAHLRRLGIAAGGTFDFEAIKKHQAQMVRTSMLGVQKSLRDSGIEIRRGEARIISPAEVEVDLDGTVERISTKNIVIAWGSIPQTPPGIELSARILDSNGFLASAALPSSTAVIGGGVIGLEFAAFLAQLGARVTIIEFLERLLPFEEPETSEFIEKEMRKAGVDILCPAKVECMASGADSVEITVSRAGQTLSVAADIALVCTGRRPRLRTEELDRLGIVYSGKGITVDERMGTSIPGVYAVGDITGGAMLAHRADRQGKALASSLFGDGSVKYSDNAVPYVCYTSPNTARVGPIEAEARKLYPGVEKIGLEFGANIYARIEMQAGGFGKLLFSGERLVGATVAGHGAAELIAPLGLAVSAGLGKNDLKKWIVAHPTLSETLNPF